MKPLPKFYHRNCTVIMPSLHISPFLTGKQWKERTHGCWCSSWKQLDNEEMRIWRLGRWCKPKKGELGKIKDLSRFY